jgi:DNA replication and repair protein RecF
MFLQTLYLRNFRNYEEESFTFGPKANLIEGGNAQGKTNLLEAIYLLSCGRSFRTLHPTDLIRHGQTFFYLEAHFIKDGIGQVLKISFDGKLRKMQYNNTDYTGFSNLLGLLPSVLYTPEDISIIVGTPSERRRLIDLHIAQFDPLYVHHLMRYLKAMKQRNYLLRQKKTAGIEAWENSMAVSACYLIKKREESIASLNPQVSKCMRDLSKDADSLQLAYVPSIASGLVEHFQEQFGKHRAREMHLGATLIGPHRDDIHLLINDKQAKFFSSEGQKRCCVAAIRLAEWERLHQIIGTPPLIGIDDFGIHLDAERNQFFQEKVGKLGQTFLTSPTFSPNAQSMSQSLTFLIENGRSVLNSNI